MSNKNYLNEELQKLGYGPLESDTECFLYLSYSLSCNPNLPVFKIGRIEMPSVSHADLDKKLKSQLY